MERGPASAGPRVSVSVLLRRLVQLAGVCPAIFSVFTVIQEWESPYMVSYPSGRAVAPEDCDYAGRPVGPAFPVGVALLVAVLAVLFSAVLSLVVGVIPILCFCLWRNAKAICPSCGHEPFYEPGEPRTMSVGWTAESVVLWALVATCCLVALVTLLVIGFIVSAVFV